MSREVVIFNELTPQLMGIIEFFRANGGAVSYSIDGKDSFELIKDKKPAVAIIGVAMPGMSGIEISRRIKFDEEESETRIILISDIPNEAFKNKAIEAGCDKYFTIGEENFETDLYGFVQEAFKVKPRLHLRVRVVKDVILLVGEKKVPAQSINLSMSGILVICQEDLQMGQDITLVIRGENKDHIHIKGVIARTVEVPDNTGVRTGLGIKFTALPEDQALKLQQLIEKIKSGGGYSFEGKKIDLQPLIDLFLMEDAFFAEYLGSLMQEEEEGASPESESQETQKEQIFDFYFPKLQSWEITAFAGGDERSEIYLSLIRKMVMLFVKYENLSRVLDDVPYSDDQQERTLLNTLESLMEVGATTENSVDHLLQSGESFGVAGLSNKINKTKRKYTDSKVRLLKSLFEHYEEVLPKKPMLQDVVAGFNARFDELKSDFEELRKEFNRGIKERKEVTKEKESGPKRERTKEFKKNSKTIAIVGGILIFVATIAFVYAKFLVGRVDLDKYADPGVVKSGKMIEGVLNLVADDGWNPERNKAITRNTLEKIYKKVRKDNIFKMKLVDKSGRNIGVVVANRNREYKILVF